MLSAIAKLAKDIVTVAQFTIFTFQLFQTLTFIYHLHKYNPERYPLTLQEWGIMFTAHNKAF